MNFIWVHEYSYPFSLPSGIDFYCHTKGIILSIVDQNMSTRLGSLSLGKKLNISAKNRHERALTDDRNSFLNNLRWSSWNRVNFNLVILDAADEKSETEENFSAKNYSGWNHFWWNYYIILHLNVKWEREKTETMTIEISFPLDDVIIVATFYTLYRWIRIQSIKYLLISEINVVKFFHEIF